MPPGAISFSAPIVIRQASVASLGVTETDVVIIKDNEMPLRKSQLSIYHSANLGSHTAIKLRYYVSLKKDPASSVEGSASTNTDWYEIPVKDLSTGILSDIPSQIVAGLTQLVEDLGLSAGFAFKVTAQGVGAGTDGAITTTVCAKDN